MIPTIIEITVATSDVVPCSQYSLDGRTISSKPAHGFSNQKQEWLRETPQESAMPCLGLEIAKRAYY